MSPMAFAVVSSLAMMLQASNAAKPPSAQDAKLACRDIPAAEWSGTALTNPQDVRAVQEIKPETPGSETETIVQRWGARIVLRAQPGMTAEWLRRVAECHMAQVAAPGGLPATPSPLDVKGASVSVQSAGDGFAVDLTSSDPKVGRQILARAQTLAPQAGRRD